MALDFSQIVITPRNLDSVHELVRQAKAWTVFCMKDNPMKFFVMRTPVNEAVEEHLRAVHGDALHMIFKPHPEGCDLCAYPCPEDHAQLRSLTKIGVV